MLLLFYITEIEKKLIGEKAFEAPFIPDPLPDIISKNCANGGAYMIKEESYKKSPRITKASTNSKPP